ncbi:anaphase-promoting complex subunit 16-like [Branchiostoma lanceolatum]|uniref:Anaphase-promoting complex subunit 16 n=1 Tax=Branchiostoma lanceolatum TaxID=7740 RepID=A0A8J9Z2I5_BRALA|nr:ANAPC16 [Branchiostoma lanceolatum]
MASVRNNPSNVEDVFVAMAAMAPRKALFQSPKEDELVEDGSQSLVNKLMMDFDVASVRRSTNAELHQQRLNVLRLRLEETAADNWRYKPVDKLMGL